jgi:starch phosphorylase
MMKRSISQLGPFLSSSRMVRDYATDLYGPAAVASARLAADGYAGAKELAGWRRRVLDAWHEVHVDDVVADESVGDLSTTRPVTATVALGSLSPAEVQVQLLSGLVGQAGELEATTPYEMSPDGDVVDGHVTYRTELPLEVAGRRGITVRVVPRHELLANSLELACVAWAG